MTLLEEAREFWFRTGGHPHSEEISADGFAITAAQFASEQIAIATREKDEKLANKVQAALDVHNRMVATNRPSGQLMHACDMCEALNAICGLLSEGK